MKKTLLTTALIGCAFASAAHAENKVVLYGILDGGYKFDQRRTTVDSSRAAKLGTVNPADGTISGLKNKPLGLSSVHHLRWDQNPDGTYTTVATGPREHYTVRDQNIGFASSMQKASRWGLIGEEDIGTDLKALFKLENGFDLGNGRTGQGGRLFGREAYVGLRGEWGTLTLGRSYNAADAIMTPIDPYGTNFSWSSASAAFSSLLTTRADNMIKYYSPEFNGFSFIVGGWADHKRHKESGLRSTLNGEQLVNGEPRAYTNPYTDQTYPYSVPYSDTYRKSTGSYGVTAGFQYDMKPLRLAASYDLLWNREKEEGFDGANNIRDHRTTDRAHMWSVGGWYDFDVVTIRAMYGQAIDGLFGARGREDGELDDDLFNPLNQGYFVRGVDPLSKGYRLQAWMVGANVPVGEQGQILFSYQGNTQKNNRDEANLNPNDHARVTGHIWSLGYTHNLTKRTSFYGLAAYGTSKERTHDEWDTEYKHKRTMFSIGLTHTF